MLPVHTSQCGPECKGAISPSQLMKFRDTCQRQWAFPKFGQMYEEKKSFNDLGDVVHAALEKYLHKGVLPATGNSQIGRIVYHAVPHLPDPNPGHVCEGHVNHFAYGITWHGYIDFLPANQCAVWDFKTTVNEKWIKTVEELKEDPQVLIYGLIELEKPENRTVNHCDFTWVYMITKGRYVTQKVNFTLHREELHQRFKEFVFPHALAMTREMTAHEKTVKEYDTQRQHLIDAGGEDVGVWYPKTHGVEYINAHLKPNPSACDSYGGCTFRGICQIPNGKRLEAFMAKDFQTRLSSVLGNKSQPAAAPEKASLFGKKKAMPDPEIEDMGDPEDDEEEEEKDEESLQLNPEDSTEDEDVQPAPKRRGRPPGVKNKPKAAVKAPPVEEPEEENTQPVAEPSAAFVLCIDCMPLSSSPIVRLGDQIHQVIDTLNAEAGTVFETADEARYGSAPAIVLDKYKSMFKTDVLAGSIVFANGSDKYQSVVIRYLATIAAAVYARVG